MVSGHFALGLGVLKFVGVSAGGVAIGLAAAEPLRLTYEQRIHRLEPETGDGADEAGNQAEASRWMRDLRRELISVERARLAELRRRGEISAESVRRIEHELDLEESRLS